MQELYPWQQQPWRRLWSQHQQGRLPHALLLTGPAGLGKLMFARRFAQYLLCQAATGHACGQCGGCRLILAGNHPDLLNIVPEESGKNIKVDQIRELILTVNQTAQRAGYHVAIVAPAQALNKAAANALLKTLEEPFGKVVLLLVSDQPGVLPATIVSRCQSIQFAVAAADAEVWLAAQLQALNSQADAKVLLAVAENAPLRALDLAQNNYLGLRDQLLTHWIAVSQRKAPLLQPVADYLKQDLTMWVDAFISLVTDLLRLHLNVRAQFLMNQDRLPQLQQLAPIYLLPQVLPLLTQLQQARRALLSSQIHLNEQLLLESLLISLV